MRIAVDLSGLQNQSSVQSLKEALELVDSMSRADGVADAVAFQLFARTDRPDLQLSPSAARCIDFVNVAGLPNAAADILYRTVLMSCGADYALQFGDLRSDQVDPSSGFPRMPTGVLGNFSNVTQMPGGISIPIGDTGEANAVERILRSLRQIPLSFNDFAYRRAVGENAGATVSPKRRVGFLSPFPPVQSGVADYSEEIVTPLREHFDLDFYTAEGCAPRLADSFVVRGYTALERDLRDRKTKRPYDFLIYQFGNNSVFHADMYALLLRYAGIVVLHDYVMTDLVMGVHYNRPDLGVWLPDEFAHHCGPDLGADMFAKLERGEINPEGLVKGGVQLTRRVFTRALGVIVHNQWSYDMAIQHHRADNALIALIPPVMPPVPLDDTPESIAALRTKYHVPVNAFVIAPCGIVTKTKRPFEILDAFRTLLTDRPDAHLVFVGSVSNRDLPPGVDFSEEIARRGLTECVTISGYVDVPTFNEYLRLSDVCVTLRYPSQGETSGALLRMLVHGKASIVTAIGSFANFPDETVHKLPIPEGMSRDAEVSIILEAFKKLATDDIYRLELGLRGAEYIRSEHSPERCARLYAEFGEAVLRHPATKAKLAADYAVRELARHDVDFGSVTPDEVFAAFSRELVTRAAEPSVSSPHLAASA